MKINNPYDKVYHQNRIPISKNTSMEEAEEISRQLSMLYNTFGMALKDLISLLGFLYHPKQQPTLQSTNSQKENESNSHSKGSLASRMGIAQISQRFEKYRKIEAIKQEKNEGIDFDKYTHKMSAEISKPSKIKSVIEDNEHCGRIQVPRGKKQRQTLNGYSCLECQNFYKALGEEFSDSNGTNRLCDGCSRHRSNMPPTNFFTQFSQQFGFED